MVDRVVQPNEPFLRSRLDVLPLDKMLPGLLVVMQCHDSYFLPTELQLMDYGSQCKAVALELAWQLDLLLCKVWTHLNWTRTMLCYPSLVSHVEKFCKFRNGPSRMRSILRILDDLY